jgi:xanthine dehydrogenase accessory factor
LKEDALAREATERLHRPAVLVMGAGHVGRALADQLQHLPVRSVLVDTRARELGLCDAAVEKRLTALPEADIRAAAPGSAFLILTHDHALDFLLAAEALGRGDAAYTGMIGSRTKRSAFVNWCRRQAGVDPGALICPIGAGATGDKRPAVIAALTVAEVMSALTRARVPQQAAVR